MKYYGENKSTYKMVRNPATGLYEYNMDTTQQKDGKRNYCVIFTDKAGRETQYCSSYKVDNSNVQIIETDPTIKIIKERDIWPWILVAILVVISCVIAVFVIRERYLRKAQEKEAQLLASRSKRDEDEEGPPSTPLPDDGPVLPPRRQLQPPQWRQPQQPQPPQPYRRRLSQHRRPRLRHPPPPSPRLKPRSLQ